MSEPTPDDAIVHRVERAIGHLLRWGVMTSLALLIVGSALSFRHGRYGTTRADVARLIAGGERGPQSPHAFVDGLHDWRGQAFILAGLFVLMLTPIVRVAVSIVAFAIQRDWAFVVIASIVLALLVASFLTGEIHR